MKYREKTSIYAAILNVCLEPQLVTEILYRARLFSGTYAKYIRSLTEAGLLMKNGKKYVTTAKGKEWLSHYTAMKRLEENGAGSFNG